MAKRYAFTAFIGRFSPLHNGHIHIMREALERSDTLVIFIGSAKRPRTTRTPFTFDERVEFIRRVFPNEIKQGIIQLVPLEDILYNDTLWVSQIQRFFDFYSGRNLNVDVFGGEADPSINLPGKWRKIDDGDIALIGHKKDATSYYIDMFPQWDSIPVDPVPNCYGEDNRELDATFLRTMLLEGSADFDYFAQGNMPFELIQYVKSIDLSGPKEEYQIIKAYKKQFEGMKYPPIHHTVDTVLVQSGHILLVRRKSHPGKGLWALPGGFLNEKERLFDGAIRELKEETGVKIPEKVLRNSVKKIETFDAPNRSERGRTITTAYLITMPNGKLPKVKGMDDADKAVWVPISQVNSEQMFEDHYDIIQVMLGQREKILEGL